MASQKLAMAIQQVVGDAERQAAVGALLASVKETAASSSTLINIHLIIHYASIFFYLTSIHQWPEPHHSTRSESIPKTRLYWTSTRTARTLPMPLVGSWLHSKPAPTIVSFFASLILFVILPGFSDTDQI